MKIKYSKKFERDYNWYLKYRHIFNFDGNSDYTDKNGNPLIIRNTSGKKFPAKKCFYIYDSQGKILPCYQPDLYFQILRCKGSINFNIKQWAEGWFDCGGSYWFDQVIKEFKLLDWMIQSVLNQRLKLLN